MAHITEITQNERLFCELYVCGSAMVVGNAQKCFQEAFGKKQAEEKNIGHTVAVLLKQEHIKAYIKELRVLMEEDKEVLSGFLSENLKSIIAETSVAKYRDKRGTELSPAPLRSVAVQAIKALMDLHSIKSTPDSLAGKGGNTGVVVNVIVPNANPNDKNNDEN